MTYVRYLSLTKFTRHLTQVLIKIQITRYTPIALRSLYAYLAGFKIVARNHQSGLPTLARFPVWMKVYVSQDIDASRG